MLQSVFPSIANPDPGFGAVLSPGSGIGKKNQDLDPVSGSVMIPDHISDTVA
jgi:hypothetical protein